MTDSIFASTDASEISFLREALAQSSDAIFMATVDGTITYINSAFTAFYGWTADEVVGKVTPRILKSGVLPQQTYKEFWDAILSKKVIHDEILNKKKNGELISIERTVNAVLGETGNLLGFISIAHDITRRKILEKQINESDVRLSELAKNLNVGLYRNTPGPEGHFIEANSAIVSMFEADSLEEFLKHTVSDLYVHPDKRKETSEKMLASGFLKAEELELKTLKGKVFWASITAVMKKDDAGNVYFDGMIEDISLRKKIELEMQKLHQAIEQSPDSIVITDKDGNIEYVNPFFTQNTGYTLEEARGKNPRILQSGETPKDTYVDLWNTITTGKTWRGELKNKKKNGELYWESISISPVVDNKGASVSYVAVKKDITQQHHAIIELKKRTEDLEKMNAIMVGRELRMIELKKEMETLRRKLEEQG